MNNVDYGTPKSMEERPMISNPSSFVKRSVDLTISVFALLFLIPLIAVIAILIRCKLGSPILFTQVRPGLNFKPFKIFKFRSMTDATDAYGNVLSDAERLTKFGSWLRSTSIDEVPQFVNVIRGEMSLVGPRPLLMEYLDIYTPEQARRNSVKPGMVSIASVSGRNQLTWEEKFDMDNYYIDNQSFLLDLKVIVKTVRVVLGREGVNHAGNETMPKLTNNDK